MPTRFLLLIYLTAVFLIGTGYIAILPVFEGIDETAHYSSARQIADTWTLPVYGDSYIDQSVVDYYRQGGTSRYGAVQKYLDAPVYSAFFTRPDAMADYVEHYRQSPAPPAFRPSSIANWQAQHPPLYYLALVPVLDATRHLPLVTQFLWLRLFSLSLALGGVALGLLAARRASGGADRENAWRGFLFYPLLLPMFFTEFARLGNDSLCLLLAGLTAWLLSLRSARITTFCWLGSTLGLGLLTKALFMPIVGAIALAFVIEFRRERHEPGRRLWHMRRAVAVFVPALLLGGSWYVYALVASGHLPTGDDALRLAQQGGLTLNLKQNFSFLSLAGGLIATLTSWSWSGIAGSLTALLTPAQMPVLLLDFWIALAFCQSLRRRPINDPVWMPVWLLALFGCGLLAHLTVCIALYGYGNTPGWYLHVLLPWVAPALGAGLGAIRQRPRLGWIWRGLALYAVAFQGAAIAAEIALFTGCAVEGAHSLQFSGRYFCLDQTGDLFHRLAVNGWPHLAMIGFGGGTACAAWLWIAAAKFDKQTMNTERKHDPRS